MGMDHMTLNLLALLPPGPTQSLYDYAPGARAADEATFRRDSSSTGRHELLADAVVVTDGEAGLRPMEVFELMSSGPRVSLVIPCRSSLPYLVLHLKDVGRFCGVELEVEDSCGVIRKITTGNKQASVRVSDENKLLSMPLELVPGWNHVRLNLADICRRGFGVEHARTWEVTVTASCRVARIYFESRPFDDKELPQWLKTL